MTSRSAGPTEHIISSEEELIEIVGRMQLKSIQDLNDSLTLFRGMLDGQEMLVSFDFHDGHGILTPVEE